MNTPAPSLAQELVNLFLRIAIAVMFIVAIAFGFAARATSGTEDEQFARAGAAVQTPSQPAVENKVR